MKKDSCLFKTRRRYFARGRAHCGGGEGGVGEDKLCVEGGEADKGVVSVDYGFEKRHLSFFSDQYALY